MRIDSFAHIYTQEYINTIRDLCPAIRIETNQEGITQFLDVANREYLGYTKANTGFENVDRRVRDLDHFKVDKQAIMIGGPGIHTDRLRVSPEVTVKLAKITNDSISAAASKFPDRLIPIAEIPLLRMSEALDELDRSVNTLGMKGVQLFSNVFGKPLNLPEFRPFFEKVAKLGVPIFIHPFFPALNQRRTYEEDMTLTMILGWPYETTLAVASLVFSGIMDDYPNLKIVTHHNGAMIPFFSDRLNGYFARTGSKNKKKPIEYFRMMYHDTSMKNLSALKCAAEVLGADRLIYGTDYPFRGDGIGSLSETQETVGKLQASPEDMDRIYWKNALELFGF